MASETMASPCTCGCCGPAGDDVEPRSREQLEHDKRQAELHVEEIKRHLQELMSIKT
ncbi:MAG: hypothetical protein ACRDKY_13750 [Solirubrobacteraceae bacterium]